MIGDFNAILGAHERLGGHPPNRSNCPDFANMNVHCDLEELVARGASFTWSDGRSHIYYESKLDRALCNSSWLDHWEDHACYTLARHRSKHNSLIVSCQNRVLQGLAHFIFKQYMDAS